MSNTALFIIDVQNALANNPSTQIPQAQRLRTAIEHVLASARQVTAKQASPIVFVQHEESSEGGDLVRDTDSWKLVFGPRANVSHEFCVAKTTDDTFESNPKLAQTLRSQGVDRIVATGIQSDCCVRATCKGALAAGFQVSVLQGAHSTYDTEEKGAVEIERDVEEELRADGAKIIRFEDAIAQWEKGGVIV